MIAEILIFSRKSSAIPLHAEQLPAMLRFDAFSINVSMRLLKMMGIDERENSIDLQFKIILEWRDPRITFNNLKKDSFFNALTQKTK